MKTSIITSVLAIFVSVMSLSAGNPMKVYENVEMTDAGTKKEYVVYNEKISCAESKTVYIYNDNGNLDNKTSYKWDKTKGWAVVNEYNYKYNADGRITYLTFTKWDNNKPVQMDQLVHIYDNDGNFMAVEKIDLNGEEVAYANQK